VLRNSFTHVATFICLLYTSDFRATMTRVKVQAQPCRPHVTYCDWDKEELRPLLQREMIYTIRSSKYPRYVGDHLFILIVIFELPHQ
jgi:hypothetical protein